MYVTSFGKHSMGNLKKIDIFDKSVLLITLSRSYLNPFRLIYPGWKESTTNSHTNNQFLILFLAAFILYVLVMHDRDKEFMTLHIH